MPPRVDVEVVGPRRAYQRARPGRLAAEPPGRAGRVAPRRQVEERLRMLPIHEAHEDGDLRVRPVDGRREDGDRLAWDAAPLEDRPRQLVRRGDDHADGIELPPEL